MEIERMSEITIECCGPSVSEDTGVFEDLSRSLTLAEPNKCVPTQAKAPSEA